MLYLFSMHLDCFNVNIQYCIAVFQDVGTGGNEIKMYTEILLSVNLHSAKNISDYLGALKTRNERVTKIKVEGIHNNFNTPITPKQNSVNFKLAVAL